VSTAVSPATDDTVESLAWTWRALFLLVSSPALYCASIFAITKHMWYCTMGAAVLAARFSYSRPRESTPRRGGRGGSPGKTRRLPLSFRIVQFFLSATLSLLMEV